MDLPLETGVFPVPFNVMTITGAAGSGRSVVTEWLMRSILDTGSPLVIITPMERDEWLADLSPGIEVRDFVSLQQLDCASVNLMPLYGLCDRPDLQAMLTCALRDMVARSSMESRTRLTVIFDNYWRLSQHMASMHDFESLVTNARKLGVAVIVESQKLSDLNATPMGWRVIRNSDVNILLRAMPEWVELDTVTLGLSDEAKSFYAGLPSRSGQVDGLIRTTKSSRLQHITIALQEKRQMAGYRMAKLGKVSAKAWIRTTFGKS